MALKTPPKKKAAAKKATQAKSAKAKSAKKAPAKVAQAKKAQAKTARAKKAVQKAASQKASANKQQANKAPASKAPAAKKPSLKPAKKATRSRPGANKPVASAVKAKPVAKAGKAPGKGGAAKGAPTPAKKPSPPPDANREAGPPPVKRAPISSKYGVGDKVVHPQHGAATIAKRLKREFAGEVRDYFVLDIATESLTVMVPVDKIDAVVRSVISKTQSRNVLNSLRGEPQEAGANWSRWYKVLTEKMYSGDIFQVAEVVRDLTFAQQTKGISPALKRMLSRARMTLISELSFSLEVDDEEATRRLDKALPRIDEPVLPPV